MRISDWSSDVCSSDLVYTYRSKYLALDASGQPTLRPMTEETIASLEVPALVTYARGAGRLDFNIGYDITDQIRVDVGGTHIIGSNTSTYYDYPGYTNINKESTYNETTHSSGV